MKIMKQLLFAFILLFNNNAVAQNQASKNWATGINKILDSYPGNFTALKGEQTPGREYWISSLQIEGAGKTFIMNFEGVARFYADFVSDTSYQVALEKFKDLVIKMESVKPTCCTFSKTQKEDELIWQIQDANSGFEHLYLSLKLSRNWYTRASTARYDLQLTVFNKHKYDNIPGM
jgi:hypothetical protein